MFTSSLRILVASAVAFMVSSCGAGSGSGGTSAEVAGIAIKLFPQYSDRQSEYSLQEASSMLPMVLDLAQLGVDPQFKTARIDAQGTSIKLDRLSTDVSFSIVLTAADGSERAIRVHAVPPDLPAYTGDATGPAADGRIFTSIFAGFTPDEASFHFIFARDGSLLYFHRLNHPTFNFHKVTYADGRVRYVYVDSAGGFDPSKGSADGDVVLLDENFRELRRARLLPYRNHGPLPAENHDVIVLDDDHWVMCAYDVRTVDLTSFGGKSDSKIVAAVVQEVSGGLVLWEFDSTDYPQFYGASTEGNDFTNSASPFADYMHFNSIEYDPSDRGYLLSFRHQDAVVKILPFSGSGGPIPLKWILGGKLDQFALSPEQRFYHQHDARIVSRSGDALTISLFNNNNGHYGEHPSSAMVLALDESSHKASLIDQYWDSLDSQSQGSVQVLGPRHYLIGWGSNPQVTEVIDGVRVFGLEFGSQWNLYRAQKAS